VLGGMLVTALCFLIWGFIAPRFIANAPVASPRRAAPVAA
jgi:hypothetical protein